MLKRLRIKFIVLTIAMIAVVLACVSITLCVIDYQHSVKGIYRSLDASIAYAEDQQASEDALDNTMTSEDSSLDTKNNSSNELESTISSNELSDSDESASDKRQPEIGTLAGYPDENVIPIAVYRQNADGSFETVAAETTAFINDAVLTVALQYVNTQPDGHGILNDISLFYTKKTLDDDTILLAFVDTSPASRWQSLALLCIAIDLVALVIFFILSWHFSKWALHPTELALIQQRQFIDNASHELKTPLSVILANVSLLLQHPEHSIASQSRWIESTQTEAQHLKSLVEDMLALAVLDEYSGVQRLSRKDFTLIDISDLLKTNLLQFEALAFETSIELADTIEPNVQVYGERKGLERIMSTLIDNALKYSDSGGVVTATLSTSAHIAHLSIHNNGTPIPPEDVSHVFDRFYRADKARTRSIGGYGLGLAIARETARLFGGDIVVASAEGDGTTFTVTLPKA